MSLRLYDEFADWWHIFSLPEDYAEEAMLYCDTIALHARRPATTLLELGSGGGNNATHVKERFDLTLVDLSEEMLAASRRLNPELEHIRGDMRSVRLGRTFDAVLIQDAVMYMATRTDLAAAVVTAAEHLEPGGIALFVPDDTAETYEESTSHGGHDADGRSVRYLEWRHPPRGEVFDATMIYVFRDADGQRIEVDSHTMGLFGRDVWLALIEQAGLEPLALPYPHSTFDRPRELFAGIKPD